MEAREERDWEEWSREAVKLMQARNDSFVETFALAGRAYRWDLDVGQMAFVGADQAVVADLCVVGSVSTSEGTFLWSWANETIPAQARQRIDDVRAFGETHDLGLLTTAEWPATRAEGLEMLAVSGRILDADGVLVVPDGDRTIFLLLHRFRAQPASELPWLMHDN
ncbi:MAG TPA: hypothetical protein VJ890_20475 [Vineibacter sp.]|nr:hypothetical protein [Vineibacter sp.]